MRRLLGIGILLLGALLGSAGCDCAGEPQGEWQAVGTGLREALLAVHGTSARDVYAVGSDKGNGPAVWHFDGEGWERLATGTRGDLWWVHAFEGGPVFMGGALGTILRYEGGAFTRMPVPGLARHTIFGIWGRSPSDVYAVGSLVGRNGFIWHFDGAAWTEVAVPDGLPQDDWHDVPGFFKVWGDDQDVWVVGGRGVLLRSTAGGPFEIVASGTDATLFTVHASSGQVAAVGGGGNGVLVEESAGTWASHGPDAIPLLQGLCLGADGRGYATGFHGLVLERRSEAWTPVEHGLALDVESLHAAWMDPDGGLWSVGGNVISSTLDAGAVVHFGARVPPIRADVPDAGTDDAGAPPAMCPEEQIDPHPTGSIARRWNEANLWAIRRDIPRPGVHARNLFHTSVAMYDAWAAYDATADGYVFREKPTATNIDEARDEAISYAAFRLLTHRYQGGVGGPRSAACFRALMDRLGYDPDDTVLTGDSPRAIGNRIGQAVIDAYAGDGANEADNYRDTTGWTPTNMPLVVDNPGPGQITDPATWQQLNLAQSVTQNGIPTDSGPQGYIGANWGLVTPFAMTRSAPSAPYLDFTADVPRFDDAIVAHVVEVIVRTSQLDTTSGATIDISPGAYGNNPLGSNAGTGHPTNPVTGAPYAPHVVPLGDFGRTLAEFWADGPESETPPGHWNVLANTVADSPGFQRRFGGTGAEVDPLEWDVKVYFALNGATHDAAIAAWELKRTHLTARPITLIRYMASLGQRSDPAMPSYDPNGLPLMDGVIELVTDASSAPGERHEHLRRYVGEIAVLSWRGEPGDRDNEIGGVGWIRGVEWIAYQRRTFVTPAFPGFVSGHSTFSRSAAQVLTELTGSEYFPGGLGEFVARAPGYLFFERGPSVDVHLQWATYFDGADQAGQSRIWGGIHITPDDFFGRRAGDQIGRGAAALARTYFDGTAVP